MSETSIRENTKSGAGVKVKFAGKTSTRAEFNAKDFAKAIVRSRKRGGTKSVAEREAWQREAEAKLAQR